MRWVRHVPTIRQPVFYPEEAPDYEDGNTGSDNTQYDDGHDDTLLTPRAPSPLAT